MGEGGADRPRPEMCGICPTTAGRARAPSTAALSPDPTASASVMRNLPTIALTSRRARRLRSASLRWQRRAIFVLGGIAVHNTRSEGWQPGEAELAQALARQASLAVQLTRLAQRSRQSAEITSDVRCSVACSRLGMVSVYVRGTLNLVLQSGFCAIPAGR